ncbi:MAG: hypothetical protein GYA76_09395 [Verrucomicrobia bacterium]|jgi:hypothetical protein|nr:hypothetical protein [Verrucomicrobiota bacterium]
MSKCLGAAWVGYGCALPAWLEYLVTRPARLNNQFLYELLFDVDTPEAVAHVGLIEVESLRTAIERRDYTTRLTGLDSRLAGQNGRLAALGASPPPAVLANASAGF